MGLVRRCLARLASRGMVAFSEKNDIHISNHKIGTEMLAPGYCVFCGISLGLPLIHFVDEPFNDAESC